MKRNLSLLFLFLFLSCQNGSLTTGVGKSDAYVSMVEDINRILSTREASFSNIEGVSSFASIEINQVLSLTKLDENQAYLSVPEFGIDTIFERTEIIRTRGSIINSPGEPEYQIEFIFIFATNQNYYSESEFPLSELYYFIDFPGVFNEGISVRYLNEELSVDTVVPGDFSEFNGARLSFEYQNALFYARNANNQYIGNGYGLGNVTAEKVGQFPDF